MRRMSVDERRARLGLRHHLAAEAKTDDLVTVAGDLVGIHSTDPATVFLSAAARMRDPSAEALERALYDDLALVRTLGMRGTMFVVPVDLVPVVQAACTDALVAAQRRRTLGMMEQNGVADPERRLKELEEATLAAIEERGEATGVELSRTVPGLNQQLMVGHGTKWEGPIGLTTRVLFLLSTEQRIVRGRPRGGWTSTQYRWSPMSAWLPEYSPSLGADEARAELARRWLRAFGPAPLTDLKWWTGLTVGQVRKAVAAMNVEEVDLDGVTGVVLADDMDSTPRPETWIALLPSLDSTTMGWQQRGWYLGDHARLLFDRSGNAGPTVWSDGRVVGGWAQRKSGEVVFRLLDDVGGEAQEAIEAAADGLTDWLGDARVTPRFPTPLQRELAA